MSITAIVPAYNEAKTIGAVLTVLTGCRSIDQVIVVSDGSTDDTVKVARQFKSVQVIDLPENRGKGAALKAGMEQTTAEIALFLDADLIGLTEEHINALLEPVLDNRAPMSLGVFERGRVATDLAQKVAPYLTGQRALRRTLFEDISDPDLTRFGVEMALHRYVEERDIPAALVSLPDLSHLMKEEKLGLWKGLAARGKMYWEIIKYAASIDLNLK